MAEFTLEAITPERLAGSKTEQNLHTALSAESQAYLRYKWFEKKAKEDGFIEISRTFKEIAANEMEHAEIWFKYLGSWGSTEKNLSASAEGELFEWSTLYSEFENTARKEGYDAIADLFARVASIEKQHESTFREKYSEVQNGESFTSNSESTKWICLNCGYVFVGKEPPALCPACAHSKGYFKKKTSEN